MRRHRRRMARRQAFTLMEVLLVLVILVVLGSIVVMNFGNVQTGANINAAKSQISTLKTPLGVYRMDINQYPSTSQGLGALRQRPGDLANANKWKGPYLEQDLPADPWGNPYQYEFPGRRNPDSYDLWSFGPDGVNGTADDIGNWPDQQG